MICNNCGRVVVAKTLNNEYICICNNMFKDTEIKCRYCKKIMSLKTDNELVCMCGYRLENAD